MKNIMRAISLGLVCAIATSNAVHANQTDAKSPSKWEITKNIGYAIGMLPAILISRAFDEERGIFLGGVCGTGLLVAGGMLLRKPAALVRAEASRRALQQAKGKTSWFTTYEFTQAGNVAQDYGGLYLPSMDPFTNKGGFVPLFHRIQNELAKGYADQRTRYEDVFEEAIKEENEIVTQQTASWKDRKKMALPVFAAGLTFFGIAYERYKELQRDKKLDRRYIDCLEDENRELTQKLNKCRDLHGNMMIRLSECKQKQNACDECKRA